MLLVPDDRHVEDLRDGEVPKIRHSSWRPIANTAEMFQERSVQDAARKYTAQEDVGQFDAQVVNVIQGEFASAHAGSGPNALGSDSATTCHIVAIRNPVSSQTAIAHLDQASRVTEAMECLIAAALSRESSIDVTTADSDTRPDCDLYIVGGFPGREAAEELSRALLTALQALPCRLRVQLACLSSFNARPVLPSSSHHVNCGCNRDKHGQSSRSREDFSTFSESASEDIRQEKDAQKTNGYLPRKTSLAVDLKSGRPYPVRFEDGGRGPAWEIRQARLFAGHRPAAVTKIYNSTFDTIEVAPFQLAMEPTALVRLLSLPDDELLALTSTSPEAEDERFVRDARLQFSFVLKHLGNDGQGWLRNVFGTGDGVRPLIYPRLGASGEEQPQKHSQTEEGVSFDGTVMSRREGQNDVSKVTTSVRKSHSLRGNS